MNISLLVHILCLTLLSLRFRTHDEFVLNSMETFLRKYIYTMWRTKNEENTTALTKL